MVQNDSCSIFPTDGIASQFFAGGNKGRFHIMDAF